MILASAGRHSCMTGKDTISKILWLNVDAELQNKISSAAPHFPAAHAD